MPDADLSPVEAAAIADHWAATGRALVVKV